MRDLERCSRLSERTTNIPRLGSGVVGRSSFWRGGLEWWKEAGRELCGGQGEGLVAWGESKPESFEVRFISTSCRGEEE